MKLFEDVINGHASIRRYLKRPIPEATIERILSAASRASTSGNMQAYSIIVTRDEKIKKEIFEPHFCQDMVLSAPVLLTFCADFYRMRRWLKLNRAPDNFDNFMSFMIASIDAILAAQNAALAAEAEGLGICFLGTTLASSERIAEILNCPKEVVPIVGFTMGLPDERPMKRDRLPLEAIIHKEKYRDLSDQEIKDLYREKEKEGWKRYQQDPSLKKKVEEKGAENLAQIYTKVKYTRESHREYSQRLLDQLKKAGYIQNDFPF